MKAIRVIIQNGKARVGYKTFDTNEEADLFFAGFSIGPTKLIGTLRAIDPFHADAEEFIKGAESPTESWSGKPWGEVFEEARALANAD